MMDFARDWPKRFGWLLVVSLILVRTADAAPNVREHTTLIGQTLEDCRKQFGAELKEPVLSQFAAALHLRYVSFQHGRFVVTVGLDKGKVVALFYAHPERPGQPAPGNFSQSEIDSILKKNGGGLFWLNLRIDQDDDHERVWLRLDKKLCAVWALSDLWVAIFDMDWLASRGIDLLPR